MVKNWKDYEHFIYNRFRRIYSGAEIQYDVKIKGIRSFASRQIDILVNINELGTKLVIVIDCKYFNKKIDVKQIDEFIGFLQDVKANKGILITNKGYTKAADNRAKNDTLDVKIDIVEFDELDRYQGFGGAMIWKANNMISIPCPVGWVIDNSSVTHDALCIIYPYGLSLSAAKNLNELMYCNIVPTISRYPSLIQFVKGQEEIYLKEDSRAKFTYLTAFPNESNPDVSTILRLIETPLNSYLEYTAIIEFEKMIFYTVLVTPENKAKEYLKKLKYITNNAIPFDVNIIGE
ncbi:MAG: restriction endonuclease [Ignavibacteria bacterium]|nr:restriction endonuclease [Ignavibacteria bacterium]